MALQGLSTFCGNSNIGGLITIEYAPTDWIDPDTFEPVISSAWNWQNAVQFTEGSWLTAYVIHESMRFDERQQSALQGKYYRQQVQAIAPNLIPSVSGELDEMANYRYLLRITDRDNRKWLLGTLETPFDFRADGTSGSSGQLKHHALTWFSESPHKAYGYVPLVL